MGKVLQMMQPVSCEAQIETKKQEIKALYQKAYDEKYKNKAIGEIYKTKCNEFLQWLDENEIASRTAKRFCYLMITYYYFDTEQFAKALFSAEYALKYSEGIEITKINQFIGTIYKNLGNKYKASRYLNKSLKDYEEQGLYFPMAQIFDIKGDMLSSESMFKKAEKYYGLAENTDYVNERQYDYNKYKNCVYIRLLRLYIKKDDRDFMKCYKLYKKIEDAALKQEAKEMIKAAYGKEV